MAQAYNPNMSVISGQTTYMFEWKLESQRVMSRLYAMFVHDMDMSCAARVTN